MKKNYNSPQVTVSVVAVAQMIASSPQGISVKNGSTTNASTTDEVLSNERNGYEDDEKNGWSDGLW